MLLEDYNLKKKLIGVLDVKGCSINIIHALNKTKMSTQIQPVFGSNTKGRGHTANFWILFIKYKQSAKLGRSE